MTMISSRGRPRRTFFWWAVALAVLVIAATVWRAPLYGFFWGVLTPFSTIRNNFDSSYTAQLQAQLASTTAALADRDELYQENLQLKAMLGRTATVPQILAGVLERPPETPYDTLTIDAGTADGVGEGDWVAASGGAIIGSVEEATAHEAQVELLSSPGVQYQGVLTADGTSVPVTLVGEGGGSLTAQVPAGTAVKIGDVIAIPGVADGIEGVVSAVSSGVGQAFTTLYLQLPANPQELRYVEVWQQSAH